MLPRAGRVSVREALGNSINVPAVHALLFAGLPSLHELGARMGLTGLQPVQNYGAAFTLGGADVRLLDLAFVYATLANAGEQRGMPTLLETSQPRRALDPASILRIEGRQGRQPGGGAPVQLPLWLQAQPGPGPLGIQATRRTGRAASARLPADQRALGQ